MAKKLAALLVKHKQLLLYLVFGALTTGVNFAVYYPLYNYFSLSAALSNAIAWCAAVAFAYLTNKPLVFQSPDWSLKAVLREAGLFVACRLASGALETGLLFLLVDTLYLSGNLWKVIVSVLVVIMNYVSSKVFVFAKKKE